MPINSSRKGTIGLGQAIAYFTSQNYIVSLPISDSQSYDLIIDKDKPERVEVKTTFATRQRKTTNSYQVQICRKRHKKTYLFNPNNIDWMFIFTGAGERYLIPARDITQRYYLSLGKKWRKYKV